MFKTHLCFRGNADSLVLLGLLFGFSLFGGYSISLSDGIFRRWGVTDRCGKTKSTLHEFDNILHRLPVFVAPGLPLPVHRF